MVKKRPPRAELAPAEPPAASRWGKAHPHWLSSQRAGSVQSRSHPRSQNTSADAKAPHKWDRASDLGPSGAHWRWPGPRSRSTASVPLGAGGWMGPGADISITRRHEGQIMDRKNPQGFEVLEREDKELRSNAIKTRKRRQRDAKRKVTQSRWQAHKTIFTQTKHKATFVQASEYSPDTAKMGGESRDSEIFPAPNERAKPPSQRRYAGRTRKTQPWPGQGGPGTSPGDRGGPGTVAGKGRGREDWKLTIPEEMSGDRLRFQLRPRETDDSLYGLQALPTKIHTGR